jgi:methionine-rich copper-binding protein CopC
MTEMRRMLQLAALIASGVVPAAGLSHAFLDAAAPLVGGTISGPPKEIRLTFTEAIEPRFSGIDLTTGGGRTIPTGAAAVDPGNNKQLVLSLPPLGPGRYRVHWHVVSVDTHRTEGEYSFTIEP